MTYALLSGRQMPDRRRQNRPAHCAASVAAAVLMCVTAAAALELPDQLTTDLPGRPPGEVPRGPSGNRPSLPEGSGFEFGAASDPWAGIPSGRDLTEGQQDLAQISPDVTGDGTRYGYSDPRATSGPTRFSHLPEKLQISGSASASFRGSSASGNRSSYEQQFSDTRTFDRRASLTVNGRLLDQIPLYARASARLHPYAPSDIEWTLIWHERGLDVTYGDVRASFTRNSFANLQRQTKGLTIVGDIGSRGTFQFFGTETRGITRRETIPGEGTAGPYFLRYTPIREETVKVRIDNQDISRDRYRLDPDSGMLQFLDIIVSQSSAIEAVYEENRRGSARGRFYGLVADYRFGSTPVSATYIRQDIAGGTAGGPRESVLRTEEFFANNSTGPFTLSYRPIDTSRPIVAYVDGARRVLDRDFTFNAQSGTVQFFDIIPATATVRIEYYSFEREATPDSAKELFGLDLGHSFGNVSVGSSIAYSRGGLLSDGSRASGGSAWDVRAAYRGAGGKLTGYARYQNQDAGFSRIESTTFDQDRSGWDMVLRYSPSRRISTYIRYSRALSRTGLSLGAGQTDGSTAATLGFGYTTEQFATGADWRYRDSGRVMASLNRASSGSASSSSNRDLMSLAWSDSLGSIGLSAAYTRTLRTSTRNPAAGAEDQTPTRIRTLSETARASASYRWGTQNRASVSWSDGTTRDLLGGERGSRVRALTGDIMYVPTNGLTLTLRRTLSSSSGATYITSASVGDGSYGDGGTRLGSDRSRLGLVEDGDVGEDSDISVRQSTQAGTDVVNASTTDDATVLQLTYRPSQSYYIGTSARQDTYRSSGGIGYISDQSRRSLSLDVGWDPNRSFRLDGRWSLSETNYLQRSRGRVRHQGWGVTASWRPNRDFRVATGYDISRSVSPSFRGGGDTGLTLLNSNAYDNAYLELDWDISSSGRFLLDASSNRNRGALDDSDRLSLSLSYSHRVNRDVSVGVGGRWVRYNDRLSPQGTVENRSYRALTYYAELRLGF